MRSALSFKADSFYKFLYIVKKALAKKLIIFLYKKGHHTVRNKDDLSSGIETKT